VRELSGGVFSGTPPTGAFYAFLKIDPAWRPEPAARRDSKAAPATTSQSWQMAEYLIKNGRIGCVPGVDFGPSAEGYIRFCFARDRKELEGALQSMKQLFGLTVSS